ncbi:MAG TPA: hypothetical protein VFO85_07160 [Vicinamibacteria bacterium]|nr:hypothetical protein [Vicinamibacteria bacterium]
MGFEYTPQPNVSAAAARVKGPAISLIVITALGIVGQIISMVANLAGMSTMPANLPPDAERWVSLMSGGLGVVLTLVTLAVGGLIIFGAMKMMKLQGYGLAMAVSIIAMVPCLSPCCCLGIPAGIWAIVTLTNAEVKAAFS